MSGFFLIRLRRCVYVYFCLYLKKKNVFGICCWILIFLYDIIMVIYFYKMVVFMIGYFFIFIRYYELLNYYYGDRL